LEDLAAVSEYAGQNAATDYHRLRRTYSLNGDCDIFTGAEKMASIDFAVAAAGGRHCNKA
jgi:hypothetical protein